MLIKILAGLFILGTVLVVIALSYFILNLFTVVTLVDLLAGFMIALVILASSFMIGDMWLG